MVEQIIDRNYPREDYVFLAKIYETAEKYDETVKIISFFVEKNPNLNSEEKVLFSSCFRKAILKRRSSFKFIQSLDASEKKAGSKSTKYLIELKVKIENEIRRILETAISLLNDHILPSVKIDVESRVFYLKLKGDYYRYLSEICIEHEWDKVTDQAEQSYNSAYEIAKEISLTNPIRLGLALNLSVFYFDQRKNKDEACRIAKQTLEETIKLISDLEKSSKAKDSLQILNTLRENYYIWTNDLNEEDNIN